MGTLASGSIDLKSLKVAGEEVNKYITTIGNDGIKVHDATSNLNYVSITSNGMEVYSGTNSSIKVAEFKSYINIGTNNTNTYTGSATIGVGLTASKNNQIIVGRYNKENPNATFIVGDGIQQQLSTLFTVGNIQNKTVEQQFIGTGTLNTFTLNTEVSGDITITDIYPSSESYTISSHTTTTVTFNTVVSEGTVITCSYLTPTPGGYVTLGNTTKAQGKNSLTLAYNFNESQDRIAANGQTSIVFGSTIEEGTSVLYNSIIATNGISSIAYGVIDTGRIIANGNGASAHGCGKNFSSIRADGIGSSAYGHAYRGSIIGTGDGSTTFGDASYFGDITATGAGALAFGHTYGGGITSSGNGSFAGGCTYYYNGPQSSLEATGSGALAFGYAYFGTMRATGVGSVALNVATVADKRAQLAIGSYNIIDSATDTTHPSGNNTYGKYAFIIGNGTSENDRSNAMTVDWNGNLWIAGKLTAGAINSELITISEEEFTISALSANSATGAQTVSITKSGYFPKGVVGFKTGSSQLVFARCELTSRSSGSATLTYNARNVSSSSASASSASVKILWLKVTV